MLSGIFEDRVSNFILNNPDYLIEVPPQIYIKNKYTITLKDLINYIQQFYSNDFILIKQIGNYLWNNYIWKHTHQHYPKNISKNTSKSNIKIC
jgi:hypothetical protein